MTTIQDRIIKDFRDKCVLPKHIGIPNIPEDTLIVDINQLEQFLIQSIKEVQEETRKETLEIIDTELEVKLNDGSEGTDYQEGWDDACLEWDLLLNTTIDKIKRGVLSITNKEK